MRRRSLLALPVLAACGGDGVNIVMGLRKSPPTIVPGWSPLSLAGTRFWSDPRQLSASQGQVVTAAPNLAPPTMISQLVASGSGRMVQQIRGQKALKFLRTSIQQFGGAFTAGALNYPFTVAGVFCANDPNATATIFSGAPSSADNFRIQNIGTSGVYPRGLQLRANGLLAKPSFIPAGRPVSFLMTCNGGSSEITVTGFGTTSGSMGTTLAVTGLNMGIDAGGSNTYGGCIGEWFVVQGALTSGEKATALTYLDDGWFTAAPAKSVMFKGDSNTYGFGTTVTMQSFRGPIDTWQLGRPGGFFLDMMGPQQYADLANSNNAGYNGATILDTLNGSVPLSMNTPAQLAAAGYLPDVKSILIGTNDCNNNAAGYYPTALSNMALLLAAERNAQNCPTVVCTLPPSATASTQTNINGFNAGLPAVVAAENAAGGRVTICDIAAVLGSNPGPYMADNLHFNPTGAALVAATLEPVLQAVW